MGSVSYEILVRCICGKVEMYKLNCYKNPLIIVGRKEQTLPFQQIGLHSDDGIDGEPFLSSTTLYFTYDYDKKDWIVGNGFPDEKYWKYIPQIENIPEDRKNRKMPNTFISYTHNNFRDQIIHTMLENKKYECEQLYKDKFYSLNKIDKQKLSDISGIGIFRINSKSEFKLYYKKQEILGLKHPVLPDLPFGWYIEIKSNVTYTKAMLSRVGTKL